MGRAEAGHIALVSGGEIYSLVTNQEYKRAFDGNMGVIAGAPLGGLVEKDPGDKYGLAREVVASAAAVVSQGQVSRPDAGHRRPARAGKWYVIEYNIRIGVTSGPMILRLLRNPLETLPAHGAERKAGAAVSRRFEFRLLADAGRLRLSVHAGQRAAAAVGSGRQFDCDVWWNEVAGGAGRALTATGQRIADVIALAADAGSGDRQGLRRTSAKSACCPAITGRTSARASGRRGVSDSKLWSRGEGAELRICY